MVEVIFTKYTWVLGFSSCDVYVSEITSPIASLVLRVAGIAPNLLLVVCCMSLLSTLYDHNTTTSCDCVQLGSFVVSDALESLFSRTGTCIHC